METVALWGAKMKAGDMIAKFSTPIARVAGLDCIDPVTMDLRPESNCAKMKNDFNNAEHIRDYTNAVLDRIRKRGKYAEERTK